MRGNILALKRGLQVTASIVALGFSGQVLAQAGATQPATAQENTASRDDVMLGDIIVTAQKREQSLQEVPISIVAFSGAAIDALGAETMGDLDNFTPGLSVSDTSVTQPSYAIRGVSTDDFGVGTEPAVGVFIDGVYAARSGSALIFFNDIERVEVLKGPQGTLFGRNTSAGAISIITRKPSDEREMATTLTYGNYNKVRATGMLNLPMGDMLAVRLNGIINRRDGFLKDAVSGEDYGRENNWSGRAALRFRPGAGTDIVLSYDHDTTDQDAPVAIGVGPFARTDSPFGPFANDVLGGSHETRRLDAFTLNATQDLGGVTLTSLTAYRKFRTSNREDEDGTNRPDRYLDTENIERNKSFYQELRLSGNSERLNWVLGGSYFRERANQTSAVNLLTDSVDTALGNVAGFPVFSILNGLAGLPVFGLPWQETMNNVARNRSYAVFGDATLAVTPELNLTVGARYTWDQKRFSWQNGRYSAPGLSNVLAPGAVYNAILAGMGSGPAFPDGALIDVNTFYGAVLPDLIFNVGPLEGVEFQREANFKRFNPRVVVDYQIAPNAMIFASAANGYKAGGFNSVEINSFFRPEKVWNYEGGVKSELFGRRLKLNVSGYYYVYSDRQAISLENVSASGIPQYKTLTGDSQAWGIDFDSQLAVTHGLTLNLAASYIDATWKKRIERGVDISGQPTGEPRWRIVAGGRYDHELADGSSIFANASYSYTSRSRTSGSSAENDPLFVGLVNFSKFGKLRAERHLVNARIGWRLPDDRLSIALFAENLFDSRFPMGLSGISAGTLGTPYTRLNKPRFWGLELGTKF